VVQTSNQRQSYNLALIRRFDGARFGTILIQCSMGTVAVKIIEVIGQHPVQVSSVEHEHVVQALASDGAYQALNEGILPGRMRRCEKMSCV
jgi:hypothetical protein